MGLDVLEDGRGVDGVVCFLQFVAKNNLGLHLSSSNTVKKKKK